MASWSTTPLLSSDTSWSEKNGIPCVMRKMASEGKYRNATANIKISKENASFFQIGKGFSFILLSTTRRVFAFSRELSCSTALCRLPHASYISIFQSSAKCSTAAILVLQPIGSGSIPATPEGKKIKNRMLFSGPDHWRYSYYSKIFKQAGPQRTWSKSRPLSLSVFPTLGVRI